MHIQHPHTQPGRPRLSPEHSSASGPSYTVGPVVPGCPFAALSVGPVPRRQSIRFVPVNLSSTVVLEISKTDVGVSLA